MPATQFEKWQALGNDYLILERERVGFELTPARVRLLCAGHFGVFADGVLLLSRPADPAHVADLRIFNPDGSEAELSGNGAREAIMYLRRRGWTDEDAFTINTVAGEIRPRITGEHTCAVDMGVASLTSKDFPDGPEDGQGGVMAAGRLWPFRHVSIGNPQCAIHVENVQALESLDLSAIGPGIEGNDAFPNRTNVSWYTELAPGALGHIRARIFERGVGETLSSGTGASGAAIAHALSWEPALRPSHVTVELDGGELEVQVGADLRVNLTGWARPVFVGELSEDFEKEINETE
jgi:diaminopimelate epimerase